MESTKVNNHSVKFYYPDCNKPKFIITSYIELRRRQLGLTQSQLAELCGLSKNTISSYENGTYCPTLVNAYRLAGALCAYYDFDDLFDFTEILS